MNCAFFGDYKGVSGGCAKVALCSYANEGRRSLGLPSSEVAGGFTLEVGDGMQVGGCTGALVRIRSSVCRGICGVGKKGLLKAVG